MMNEETAFFDSCAGQWDAMRAENPVLLRKLLRLAGIAPGSRILDVGSGTGVLLPYLKEAAGSRGRITAVDFSAGMLSQAKKKFGQSKAISFLLGNIMEIPLPVQTYDYIICLNFFPHLQGQKRAYLKKMYDALVPMGTLAVLHDISREHVNGVHAGCEAVREDRLPPAGTVAEWFQQAGYEQLWYIDDQEKYIVKGIRPQG